MSDPQYLSDADILRAIAERYAGQPEVTTYLYAAADYLAVLQRDYQNAPEVTNTPTPPAEVQYCPMRWAVPVRSVAVGADVKEETCGRPASIPVEYQGGLYVVCPACKDDLLNMGGTECQ